MTLSETLARILGDLAERRAAHALVGGLAVSLHTEPRFTRDVDLAVAVGSDPEAERLVADLAARGYRVVAQVEQQERARLATARLLPPGRPEEGLLVDLLFASSGIEREVVDDAERLEVLPGLVASVAAVPHLVALKLLSCNDETRPQDGVDLRALIGVAGPHDIARARELLALIAARGFHRGRDLLAALDRLAD